MTGRLPRGVMWDVKTAYYLKKRPNRPFAFFLAGWAALLWGDADRADECFSGAIAADANYAPAYIGIICREIILGRYGKAAASLIKYQAKLNLAKPIHRFRLASAISACALARMKDTRGDIGPQANKGGMLARLRFTALDVYNRRLWAGNKSRTAGRHLELQQFLNLIRYTELLQRGLSLDGRNSINAGNQNANTDADAGDHNINVGAQNANAGDHNINASTSAQDANAGGLNERRILADGICAMPGILDEFRFCAAADRTRGVEGIVFTFDAPAVFKKALLNHIFREKILIGELREPRVILSNLRRDSRADIIDNANKWLFLQLCIAVNRMGDIETETARELERDGWWADPIVRVFLKSEGIAWG